MVSPVITGYYRYTDIFFEWYDRISVIMADIPVSSPLIFAGIKHSQIQRIGVRSRLR